VLVDLVALAFPEAVELALQPDAEHRPYECQPRSVAGDRPLKPGCRLRFSYVARSARQHDQRWEAAKKGTGGACRGRCPARRIRCLAAFQPGTLPT
jgi:hypothetical protein